MRMWILVSAAAACLVSGCDGRVVTPAEKVEVANSFAPQNSSNAASRPRYDTASSAAETVSAETGRASLTPSQNNAVRSAEQYLSMAGFSRNGLIQQLSSDAGDGYSVSDATAAVDSLSVDWNENAARSARQYLTMTGFSCRGLIQQLSSSAGDKYTVGQATYGAHAAGAC